MKIYLVISYDDSGESCTVVKAFDKKQNAVSFQNICREYQLREPDVDKILDGKQESVNNYYTEYEAWKNNHRAGNCHNDYYCIQEIELE